MKKLLAVAVLGAIASFGNSAQADCDGSWTNMCLSQGPTREGGVVPAARSIASKANVAEQSDLTGDMNFVSLGFGGSIILKNSCRIANVVGKDVTLFETTWGNPADVSGVSEEAKVWASQTGAAGTWVLLGTGIHNHSYDIILPWAQYFKIKDITNASIFIVGDGNDAYDVDGMTYEAILPDAPGIEPGLCGFHQGWAKGSPAVSGAGIHPYRKNHLAATILEDYPALSTFAARDNTLTYTLPAPKHYNFWSMGFGSTVDPSFMCFVLPYAVFDGAGAEFQLFETTWNNKPCPNYPETVRLWVSQDGLSWTDAGDMCKDGFLDISATGLGWVGYLKYVDKTAPGSFSAGSDAYDIDGFLILQEPPTGETPVDICSSAPTRKVVAAVDFKDNSIVPEEMEVLQVIGNPVTSDINVRFTNAEENAVSFIVRNHMGQEVSRTSHVGDLFQVEEKIIPASNLAPGVYFVTLEGVGYKETVKFVKR